MDLNKKIEELIDIAIVEDIGRGDITSHACIPDTIVTSGRFYLKQAAVIAGIPFVELLYKKLDPEISVTECLPEGSYHKAGTVIAKVSGPAKGILAGERIALNLLQHTSGIATLTAEYVRKVRGTSCQILDTRKTLPGLRALEKYAVRAGGGVNHRWGLDDRFIIKTNHLYFIDHEHNDSVSSIIDRIHQSSPNTPIEIEITSSEQLNDALNTRASAIILCQMSPDQVKKCTKKIHAANKKAYFDSLGTMTLDIIRAYAETDIDGIMISLTHSAQSVDIGMRLTKLSN